MGVHFSYQVAFGYAGEFKTFDDLPGKLEGLNREELQNLELPEGVVIDTGGAYMSGPFRWSLVLRRTQRRVARDDGNFQIIQKFDESPSDEELALLRETAESLGIFVEDTEPGWFLFSNVI